MQAATKTHPSGDFSTSSISGDPLQTRLKPVAARLNHNYAGRTFHLALHGHILVLHRISFREIVSDYQPVNVCSIRRHSRRPHEYRTLAYLFAFMAYITFLQVKSSQGLDLRWYEVSIGFWPALIMVIFGLACLISFLAGLIPFPAVTITAPGIRITSWHTPGENPAADAIFDTVDKSERKDTAASPQTIRVRHKWPFAAPMKTALHSAITAILVLGLLVIGFFFLISFFYRVLPMTDEAWSTLPTLLAETVVIVSALVFVLVLVYRGAVQAPKGRYFRRILRAFRSGDIEGARTRLQEALRQRPDDVDLLYFDFAISIEREDFRRAYQCARVIEEQHEGSEGRVTEATQILEAWYRGERANFPKLNALTLELPGK